MPYDAKQVRLFQMVRHGKLKRPGLSSRTAGKLLKEAGQSKDSGHPTKKRRASHALVRGS